jgi:phenylpyruvate tautomerase PptA (4-oxalocrotonate tautomerase family)
MSKDIDIQFTSNVVNEQGKTEIADMITGILVSTLAKRTYFWSIIYDRPYKDEYATTDARAYFQCGMVCALKEDYKQALEWYTMGAKCFTNSSVLFNDVIQLDYDFTDYKYDVRVQTWFNTQFGSKQELMNVGEVQCWDLHISDFTGQDVIDNMNTLRDEWFELIERERAVIAAVQSSCAELDAQREGGK